jgi:hypothetical protein
LLATNVQKLEPSYKSQIEDFKRLVEERPIQKKRSFSVALEEPKVEEEEREEASTEELPDYLLCLNLQRNLQLTASRTRKRQVLQQDDLDRSAGFSA